MLLKLRITLSPIYAWGDNLLLATPDAIQTFINDYGKIMLALMMATSQAHFDGLITEAGLSAEGREHWTIIEQNPEIRRQAMAKCNPQPAPVSTVSGKESKKSESISLHGSGEVRPPPERTEEQQTNGGSREGMQDQAAAKAAQAAATPIAPPAATPNLPATPAAPPVNTAVLPAEPQLAPKKEEADVKMEEEPTRKAPPAGTCSWN